MLKQTLFIITATVATSAAADNFKFCFEAWKPYGIRDDAGVNKGPTIDFYEELFKAAGHTIEFTQMPSARCYDMVTNNKIDGAIFSSEGTIKDAVNLTFVTDYWMVGAIVPPTSKLTKYKGVEQFAGKIVGVTKQYPYPDELKGFAGMKKDETIDSINSLRKVANGRIDVMFDDPLWAELEGGAEGLKFKSLRPLAAFTPNCGSLAPKNKDLAPKLNSVATDLIKNGALDKVYKKHLGMTFKAFKEKYGLNK